MVSDRVGHFFGQLLKRPTCELTDMFSQFRNYYDANPKARLYVEFSSLKCKFSSLFLTMYTFREAGRIIGQVAVLKWSLDGQYYRCRVRNESENLAEIQFIDFGDVKTVSRRDLLAPVVSDWFSQPAFGINCHLSRDGAALLKKEEWDAALLEKSVELRIVRKNPDGTYTVAFTIDPCNHSILEVLYPENIPAGKLFFFNIVSFFS